MVDKNIESLSYKYIQLHREYAKSYPDFLTFWIFYLATLILTPVMLLLVWLINEANFWERLPHVESIVLGYGIIVLIWYINILFKRRRLQKIILDLHLNNRRIVFTEGFSATNPSVIHEADLGEFKCALEKTMKVDFKKYNKLCGLR